MLPALLRASRLGALAAAIALGAVVAAPAVPARGEPAKKATKAKKAKKVKRVAQKKPPPPPPLDGTTFDYDYDGKADGHPERRWMGRVFVHKKAAERAGHPLPLLVFMHGNNAEKIKYRWMGGGSEGDLRRIVAEMIEAGLVPPMLVAGPSSIDPYTMTNAGAAWPSFDLDLFVDKTAERLGQAAVVDRGRVMVAAHSGGGCNIRGGLATAMRPKNLPLLAGFSIDTCMLLDLAVHMAKSPPTTHVVVTWQNLSWPDREFDAFKAVFKKEAKKAPANAGVLRELSFEQPTIGSAHDAMVQLTLRKYLPRILGPGTPSEPPDAGAPATDAGP